MMNIRQHYMYPNEARLRNMTYGMTIHYDVDVEHHIKTDKGEILDETIVLRKNIFRQISNYASFKLLHF